MNLADKRKYAVEKCNGKKAGHTTNGFSLQEFYDDTIRGLIEIYIKIQSLKRMCLIYLNITADL